MGAGAKGIPGASYHFATTQEYTPAPSLYSAYKAYEGYLRSTFGERVLGFVPTPRTPFGGTRFTMSLVNKLEEQYKELEGYGPSYNFSYGLLSPAFLINFVSARLSHAYMAGVSEEKARYAERLMRATSEGAPPPEPSKGREMFRGLWGVTKSVGVGAATAAGIAYLPLAGVANFGASVLASRTGVSGYHVKCARCNEMKPRGTVCPHCGFKPAYGSI